MASISKIQSDVDAAILSPHARSPSVAVSAAVSDVTPGSEEPGREPGDLPDILNLEWQREGMPDTLFNRNYPPDAWGEEAAANARVWKIYRDRQILSDKGMLNGWNKTLDVLLIFAGLFSVVLTAFLIESYKALQPDYTQYVAVFLYTAAVSHNRTGGVLPALDSIVAPDSFIQTSVLQRWTNGLWFSSLVLSLAVALLCILIKQWLDAYDSHVSAAASSPKHWARRYTLYNRGLRKWGVPGLISFLPLLLHVSLFLFFGGLVFFLRPLDGAISYSLLVMVSCIAAFYILSLLLPACRVDCPSYTPLLPHVLLATLRAIPCLGHVIGPLTIPMHLSRRRVFSSLNAWAEQALHWPESLELRARQQLAREARTISQCNLELDGYILSALILLPTDTNEDVINTAIVAIGAVTSIRTMEIISRKVLCNVFIDKVTTFYTGIRQNKAGFAVISHAQVCRASQAMWIHNASHWQRRWTTVYDFSLRSRLGIDGLFLEVMGQKDDDREFDVNPVIQQLQSLSLAENGSRGFPLRSTCLILLEHCTSRSHHNPQFLSFFLLVFCSGRFPSADRHELVRALRSVEVMLTKHCFITLPAKNGGERDYILAVLNGLWIMLADCGQYHVDALTAQIVARQAIACFIETCSSEPDIVRAQISGLATFIRCPTFGHCVGAGYDFANYILPFRHFSMIDRANYWECISILLKMTWDCAPPPRDAVSLSMAYFLFPVEPSNWTPYYRFRQGGAYSTREDWCEPALSAFLTGQSAISTWTGINSPDRDSRCMGDLAALAYRISIVLCRWQRLGRDNHAFVRGFFSGTFLLAVFQDLASPDPIPERGITFELAKHCLKLSPERFMTIIAQLEDSGETGSGLRARTVPFAARIRDGGTPGGALAEECSNCGCLVDRAARGWKAVWNELAARFRRGRTEDVTAEHV